MNLVLIAALLGLCQVAKSGRIAMFTMPLSTSHRRSLFPLASALAAKGHHVDIVGISILNETKKLTPFRERTIDIDPPDRLLLDNFRFVNDSGIRRLFWGQANSESVGGTLFPWGLFSLSCYYATQERLGEMEEIMSEPWDLVIVDEFFNTCGLAMASEIDAPKVLTTTQGIYQQDSYFTGLPHNPALVSTAFLTGRFDSVNFASRLKGTWDDLVVMAAFRWPVSWIVSLVGAPLTRDFPGWGEFVRSTALTLSDLPLELENVRPSARDLVLGGSYCPTSVGRPKELPRDYAAFVEDPRSKGTILVAFGTWVRWSLAPEAATRAFYAALRELSEYRIVWQYDGAPLADLPGHMKVGPWHPQVELLAHPATRAFVSHAGLKSLREALCLGVPLVSMPFFAEQRRNAYLLVSAGVGGFLEKSDVRTALVVAELRRVLADPTFEARAKSLQARLRDQMMAGTDLTTFWLEFTMRRRGVPERFFHSQARNLTNVQFYYLDWVAFLLFVVYVSRKIWSRVPNLL